MTYRGSQRIRRLAASLPLAALVLETDAPDIPPQWLRDGAHVARNEPAELPRIAQELLALRQAGAGGAATLDELAAATRANAAAALPRLAALLT